MSTNRCTYPRQLARALVAILTTIGGSSEAAEYEVATMTASVGGSWYSANKTSPGKFVLEYLASWPQQFNMRVVFLNRDWRAHGCPPGQVVFTRNGQTQSGRLIVGTTDHMTYEFPSVPRSGSQVFRATCEVKKGARTLYVVSGGASLRFEENPALGWDPGLPGPRAGTYEIVAPTEGQRVARTEPVQVQLRKKKTSFPPPQRVSIALEKAVSSQSGVVGDIALPQNKVYIQWKALTVVKLDSSWISEGETLKCVVQLPGFLGLARTPEHEAGLYRLQVVGTGPTDPLSPWRSFQVPAKPVLQKVK